MINSTTRGWIFDIVVGGLAGGVAGAIVAVNVVIYLGPDSGYQSTLSDVYQDNTLVGIMTTTVLLLGPFLGVLIARRQRRRTSGRA